MLCWSEGSYNNWWHIGAAIIGGQDRFSADMNWRWLIFLFFIFNDHFNVKVQEISIIWNKRGSGLINWHPIWVSRSPVSQVKLLYSMCQALWMEEGRAMLVQILTNTWESGNPMHGIPTEPLSWQFASAKPIIDICWREKRRRGVHVSSAAAGRRRKAPRCWVVLYVGEPSRLKTFESSQIHWECG